MVALPGGRKNHSGLVYLPPPSLASRVSPRESLETAVSEPVPTLRSEGEIIRVSGAVKRRLTDLQNERRRELGRQVSYSEVIEQLLAGQWGDKP